MNAVMTEIELETERIYLRDAANDAAKASKAAWDAFVEPLTLKQYIRHVQARPIQLVTAPSPTHAHRLTVALNAYSASREASLAYAQFIRCLERNVP